MAQETFRVPAPRGEALRSLLAGGLCALLLFVIMALAQMLGEVQPPKKDLDETVIAFNPPDIEEIEEEEPPEVEEEEPPPELEQEPPQLSLDQLDIALNPGTGGAITADFSLPSIGTSSKDLGTEDFVDFSDLDQIPRPIGVSGFNFPRRLLRQPANGRLVLLVRLDESGRVLDVQLDSSNLPAFDDFVLGEVAKWRFTPPTKQGNPVKAKARLPIPINVRP